nr:hypothetical protein BaRGS_009976 [Batillaria attramentaria]
MFRQSLLPLVNVPMLDYTLDFLASAGVQETFVFCCHLADQIRTHIRNSRWGRSSSSMQVRPVLSDGCRSVGDALREIDAKSLVRNDFFLLLGDAVANLNLKEVMEEHKQRIKKTKSSVMTMLFKKAPPKHRTRCAEDNVLMAVDPNTNRVHHWQKTVLDKNLRIPLELWEENPDLVLRQDLLDCQLCVCTPAVPPLFTDNFDYSTMDDFVRGILIDEEILGNTIHINVVQDSYCARVSNPYMYDAISRDIIQRWVVPQTADGMNIIRSDHVTQCRHNVYLSKDVSLARGCVLVQNVVLAGGTSVQTKTTITDSVVGKNCKIGANVKIKGCYLWDSVTVEDNCVLEGAIICDNVTIYTNTTVQHRTILSWNVKVGPDIKLPSNLRLQAQPQVDEFADTAVQDVPDVTPEYGSKSRAFPFREETDSEDEGEEQLGSEWGEPLIPKQEDGDDEEDEEEDDAILSDSDLDEDISPADSPVPDDFGMFYGEVLDTLKRAREENISTDNVILEINSLKHAYNIAISDVHHGVIKVLIDQPLRDNPDKKGPQLLTVVLKHLDSHLSLIKNYIKSAEAQLDCLHSLEDFAIDNEVVSSILVKVVHHLYNRDILDEGVILKWHQTIPDMMHEVEDHKRIRKQMEAFINWLEEAEEETDDDEDD